MGGCGFSRTPGEGGGEVKEIHQSCNLSLLEIYDALLRGHLILAALDVIPWQAVDSLAMAFLAYLYLDWLSLYRQHHIRKMGQNLGETRVASFSAPYELVWYRLYRWCQASWTWLAQSSPTELDHRHPVDEPPIYVRVANQSLALVPKALFCWVNWIYILCFTLAVLNMKRGELRFSISLIKVLLISPCCVGKYIFWTAISFRFPLLEVAAVDVH